MKQNEFESVISLRKVFGFPKTKRTRKAINEIKAFALKHEKNAQVGISGEVNRLLQENSRNIPRKINAVLVKSGKKVTVYLSGGKQLKEDRKREAEEKEKKKKEQKEKEEKEKPKKEEETEQKEKLQDKKEKEKAAKSLEMQGRK